jgi:hypothetical protein
MAVVNVSSNLYPVKGSPTTSLDPQFTKGRPVIVNGTITNLSTDNTLSKYKMVDIPSHAILLPQSYFDVTNWGFATINIGTLANAVALVNVLKSAGNIHVPAAIAAGGASATKMLWDALGLAADPGGNITLYANGPANATGAGSMKFQIWYADRN